MGTASSLMCFDVDFKALTNFLVLLWAAASDYRTARPLEFERHIDTYSRRLQGTDETSCSTLGCCLRLPSASVGPNRLSASYLTTDLQRSYPGLPATSYLLKIFGQGGGEGNYRGPIVPRGLPKSLPRHLPNVPRENHGSKTAGEAVFLERKCPFLLGRNGSMFSLGKV